MPGAEVSDVLLSVVDDLRPDVGELTAGESLPEREHPSANAVPRLPHHHVVARGLDLSRGD